MNKYFFLISTLYVDLSAENMFRIRDRPTVENLIDNPIISHHHHIIKTIKSPQPAQNNTQRWRHFIPHP